MRGRRRAVRCCFDREGVGSVGQLVARRVESVKDRRVRVRVFGGVHLGVDGVRNFRCPVEGVLSCAVARVRAHNRTGLVPVGVGHHRHVSQQDSTRCNRRRCSRQSRTRDDVAGTVESHARLIERSARRQVDQGRPVGVEVASLRVEDAGVSPGSVEPHVGNRQVGCPVGAREGDGTVNKGSLRRVRGGVRGKLSLRGHRDGHGGTRSGGHAQRVRREDQGDTLIRPVLGVLGEVPVFGDLGESLASERVGVVVAGQVGQPHREAPALRSISEVCLRARWVGRSFHGRVDGRGGCHDRVDEASTDSARRVIGSVALLNVLERMSGAHQDIRDDSVLICVAHAREQRIACDALTHEGGHAGDVRACLRGAGHSHVLVKISSGDDIAAGCGDLGLECEVG